MFIGQFANDDFHFTSLVNYQKHQENAPSLFDMKHYTELEKEKGNLTFLKLDLRYKFDYHFTLERYRIDVWNCLR